MDIEVNYWTVVIAAIVYYAGGILWYSPILFGRIWSSLEGIKEEQIEGKKKKMWMSYITALISALVMSYILAHIINYMKANTFLEGLKAGFFCWLGFVITTSLTNNIFANRSIKLLLINSGYHLYGLLVMGTILVI